MAFSSLVPQTSFRGETSGSVTICKLFLFPTLAGLRGLWRGKLQEQIKWARISCTRTCCKSSSQFFAWEIPVLHLFRDLNDLYWNDNFCAPTFNYGFSTDHSSIAKLQRHFHSKNHGFIFVNFAIADIISRTSKKINKYSFPLHLRNPSVYL